MSLMLLFTAALSATFVMLVMARVFRPPRRLAPRLELYTAPSRVRLGTLDASDASIAMSGDGTIRLGSTFQEIIKPLMLQIAESFGTVLDAGESDDLGLRLRRAGQRIDAEDYRLRQLLLTVAGVGLGFMIGYANLGSVALGLFMAALFGFAGAIVQRTVLDRRLNDRIEQIRGELYTIVHLLAMFVRTGHGPVESVRRVTERSSGIVSAEMSQALAWIERGRSAQASFDDLAFFTPEPAATRLYKLVASATVSGTDITESLIALARDLRNQRRDELERRAVKRRSGMILPLLIFSAPVLLLLIGAPAVNLILSQF